MRIADCGMLNVDSPVNSIVRTTERFIQERPALRKASVGGPPALRPAVLCRGNPPKADGCPCRGVMQYALTVGR